jgi:hypothetical protein
MPSNNNLETMFVQQIFLDSLYSFFALFFAFFLFAYSLRTLQNKSHFLYLIKLNPIKILL